MTKSEFITLLKNELKDISKDEREDIISDYEEHFTAGLKKGKTEAEICEKLGDPRKIAKESKAVAAIQNIKNDFSVNNIFRVFMTFSSLGLFNLIFIFPYMFIVYMLASMAFVALVILVAGIIQFAIGIMNIFFGNFPIALDPSNAVPYSIIAISAGFVLLILDVLFIKYFYKFTVRYIKMNIGMLKNEKDY